MYNHICPPLTLSVWLASADSTKQWCQRLNDSWQALADWSLPVPAAVGAAYSTRTRAPWSIDQSHHSWQQWSFERTLFRCSPIAFKAANDRCHRNVKAATPLLPDSAHFTLAPLPKENHTLCAWVSGKQNSEFTYLAGLNSSKHSYDC